MNSSRNSKREKGQAILEAAVLIPVFVFVCLGLIDLQWALSKVGSLEFVVNETARCEANTWNRATHDFEEVITAPSPCAYPPGPDSYATTLAENLRMASPQFAVDKPGWCDELTGICTAQMSYAYKPLGAWFPKITITRTGIASMKP